MPYTRPPLSKDLLAGVDDVDSTPLPGRRARRHVAAGRAGHRGSTPPRKRVALESGDAVAYDQAHPRHRLPRAPVDRARAPTSTACTRCATSTTRSRCSARSTGKPKLAIVGAGFIGCEVAASARKLGIDVTLDRHRAAADARRSARRSAPLRRHAPRARRRPAARHRHRGAARRRPRRGDRAAPTARASTRDVVVIALGAIPNTEWLEGSGLTLEPGVLCDGDARGRGAEDVFAAGDIAAWPHPLAPDAPIRIEHWTNAAEQGTLAGRNAVVRPGRAQARTRASRSFWSDQYDVKIQAVGLPRARRARAHGRESRPRATASSPSASATAGSSPRYALERRAAAAVSTASRSASRRERRRRPRRRRGTTRRRSERRSRA